MSRFKVKLGEKTTNSSNGVPQGGINSPHLFNICLIGMMNILEKFPVQYFFYADDLVIYGELDQLRKCL